MNNCPNCGQPAEPGAAFCGNCGQPLSAEPPVTPPSSGVPPPATAQGAASVSPIAQVYNTPQTLPGNPASQAFGSVALAGSAVTRLPAYAIAPPGTHHTKAVLSVVFGGIGILAAVVPILGLGLGITGLILATLSPRALARRLKIAGIILSCLAIVASLAVWTILATRAVQSHSTGVTTGNSKTAVATITSSNLSTGCYSVGFTGDLNIENQSGSCNMNAYNGTSLENSTEFYKVLATTTTTLNAASFPATAKKALEADVRENLPGFTISAEQAGTFASSQAYTVTAANASSSVTVSEAAVLHSGASDNFFIIVHAKTARTADDKDLEAHWQWK